MSRDFGANLRYQRNQRRMTQAEFAAYLEVSLSAYRMYERGEREPTFDILCKIANMLGMRVDDLVKRPVTDEDALDHTHRELLRLYDNAYPEIIQQLTMEVLLMHQRVHTGEEEPQDDL